MFFLWTQMKCINKQLLRDVNWLYKCMWKSTWNKTILNVLLCQKTQDSPHFRLQFHFFVAITCAYIWNWYLWHGKWRCKWENGWYNIIWMSLKELYAVQRVTSLDNCNKNAARVLYICVKHHSSLELKA